MANFLLSYKNWSDQAGVVLSASHEVSTLPVANLQSPDILKIWRAPATTVWARASLGATRAIRVLGLFGLKALADTDTIRWRLGTTPGGAEIYDSGVVACNRVRRFARSIHCLPASVNASHVQVDLVGTSQSPTPGYLDVGRLWVGDAWQGTRNFSYGITHAIDDGKSRQVASDGAPNSSIYVDPRAAGQVVGFQLEAVTEAEAWDQVTEAMLEAGSKRQVLFVPDPDSAYLNRAAVLGLIEKSDPIKHMAFPVRSAGFEIRGPLLEE